MFRTPPAQGAERRLQGRFMEFPPMYDARVDREQDLGTKLSSLDRKITAHLRLLFDRTEELAGRSTVLEAAQQALREDTRGVVEGLVARASEKFDRQEASQIALHSDMQQAVVEARETRQAVERVYEGAQSEFAALQRTVQTLQQAMQTRDQIIEN